MKSIVSILLVLPLALFLIHGIARRRQSQPKLLRIPFFSKSLRLAALLLVILGAGREVQAQGERKVDGENENEEDQLTLSQKQLDNWHNWQKRATWKEGRLRILDFYSRPEVHRAEDIALLQPLLRQLPYDFACILEADLKALAGAEQLPVPNLLKLAEAAVELGTQGRFDPALDAILFHLYARAAEDGDEESEREFMATMAERARISDALILSMAEAGPITISPRAWMSKAGHGSSLAHLESVARSRLLAATRERLKDLKDSQALGPVFTTVTVLSGSLSQQEGAARGRQIVEGRLVELSRFTLLSSVEGAEIEQLWLGQMTLPKKEVLSLRDWPRLLDAKQRGKIGEAIQRAFEGDLVAQGLIELSLPFAFPQLSQALATHKPAPGRDALATMLRRFDGFLPRSIPDFQYEKAQAESLDGKEQDHGQ